MHPSTQYRRYAMFGLRVESAIDLPELPPAPDGEAADLEIRCGAVRDKGPGHLLEIPSVARFRISGGQRIIVDPATDADPRDIRLFLLGSAMGIALHQRSILPLHANAVDVGGGAVAFMGPSGAGKSTLAAWFHDNGFTVLADDVCVVTLEDGMPFAYPGLPRLRLWRDALVASGRNADDHPPSYRPNSREKDHKFDVAIARTEIPSVALPLKAIFLLEEGSSLDIKPLQGMAAVDVLSTNTYRGGFIRKVGDPERHLATCVAIAQTVPVSRLVRPFDRGRFDQQCRAILALIAKR